LNKEVEGEVGMPGVFHDLSKRLSMSSGIILMLVISFFGKNYWPVQFLTVLFVSTITMAAMIEYVALVKHKGDPPSKYLLAAIGVFWPFAFFFFPSWIWLILIFLGFFIYNFLSIDGAIYRVATGSFAMLYILVPIGMILSILYPEGVGSKGDVNLVVYLLAVTKIADIGGYFMGRLFGKKKLAPKISPSKTVVGAVFGLLSSLLMSLFLSTYVNISIYEAVFLGIILGGAAELGDLAESVLKRDAQVKDSNQIPGLGGVLDLIDSLLFTTPILFAYFRF
jgi:phosphatidate cytidylyltransferase